MTMTRKDAIKTLRELWRETNNPWYEEVYNMAIEALSDRPTGRWIDYSDEGYVECPFCHSATNCDGNKDELHFCFSCGAKMKGGDDE